MVLGKFLDSEEAYSRCGSLWHPGDDSELFDDVMGVGFREDCSVRSTPSSGHLPGEIFPLPEGCLCVRSSSKVLG
jgi:hypothetical protein